MAVLSVAFAAFAALLGVLIRHSGETQERSTLQTEARAAIDRLVQDLRQANTGDAGTPILSLGSSQITFLSPDRATPFRLRQIAYRVSGDRLERAMAVSTNTGGPPGRFRRSERGSHRRARSSTRPCSATSTPPVWLRPTPPGCAR